MRFCDKLYVGKGVRDIGKTVKDIYKKKGIHSIFCVCLSQSQGECRRPALLEIMSISEMYRAEGITGERTILGLGKGKNEATQIVLSIVNDIIKAGNTIDHSAIDRLIKDELT